MRAAFLPSFVCALSYLDFMESVVIALLYVYFPIDVSKSIPARFLFSSVREQCTCFFRLFMCLFLLQCVVSDKTWFAILRPQRSQFALLFDDLVWLWIVNCVAFYFFARCEVGLRWLS